MLKTFTETLKVLSPREKRGFFALIIFFGLVSGIQVVSLGAIIPFLRLILDPSAVSDFEILATIKDRLGIEENRNFALIVGAASVGLYITSLILGTVIGYVNFRFVERCRVRFSRSLLRQFMENSYLDFLKRNSAEVLQTLTGNLELYTRNYLLNWMTLISSALIATAVVGAVLFVSPGTSMILLLIVTGLLVAIYYGIRRRLKIIGRRKVEGRITLTRIVNETVGGFKELKVLCRMREAYAEFRSTQELLLRNECQSQLLKSVPLLLVQVIGMVFLFGFLCYFALAGRSMESGIALLGFFALATRQILPAANTIFNAIQSLRQTNELAENYLTLFQQWQAHPAPEFVGGEAGRRSPPRLTLAKSLSLTGASFSYPSRKEAGVRDIDLIIPARTSLALVGSSGAGKSTLADLVLGVIELQTGEIWVDGVLLDSANLTDWQRNIGYVPQSIFLADATIRQNIALGLSNDAIDEGALIAAAASAQLHDFIIEELPEGYDTVVGERGVRLSGGQRQRIGIARALYHNPEIVVFDEATSALDNETERSVMAAIDSMAGERTVILIAHRLSTVRQCDQIAVLERGRIVATGSYDQLSASSPAFQALLHSGREA